MKTWAHELTICNDFTYRFGGLAEGRVMAENATFSNPFTDENAEMKICTLNWSRNQKSSSRKTYAKSIFNYCFSYQQYGITVYVRKKLFHRVNIVNKILNGKQLAAFKSAKMHRVAQFIMFDEPTSSWILVSTFSQRFSTIEIFIVERTKKCEIQSFEWFQEKVYRPQDT